MIKDEIEKQINQENNKTPKRSIKKQGLNWILKSN